VVTIVTLSNVTVPAPARRKPRPDIDGAPAVSMR
jgi:hypothetical protein